MIEKFGISTEKKTTEKEIVISGFDFNQAFFDEMKNLGGTFEQNTYSFKFPFSDALSRRIDEVLSFYWKDGKSLTVGQRELRDKIIKKLDGLDFVFKKDGYGFAFYDMNECCGTPKQIKEELHRLGIKTKMIRNSRRIYLF